MGTPWDFQMPLRTWMEAVQAIVISGKLTTGGFVCGLGKGLVLHSRFPNSDKVRALGRHGTMPAGHCGLSPHPHRLRSTLGDPGKDTAIANKQAEMRGETGIECTCFNQIVNSPKARNSLLYLS